jgi:hypothetical protein
MLSSPKSRTLWLAFDVVPASVYRDQQLNIDEQVLAASVNLKCE